MHRRRRRNAVIALGNPLLCDDGAALYAMGLLKTRRRVRGVDFVENHSGGMDLLDDLVERDRVLLLDAVLTLRHEAGSLVEFSFADLEETRQARLVDSHGLNLVSVLEAGRCFGLSMPREIRILGIEGRDFTSFRERPGDAVMAAMPDIVARLERILMEREGVDVA